MDLSSFVLIVDEHIKRALCEDITSEDVSTAAVMPEAHRGTVELIASCWVSYTPTFVLCFQVSVWL